MRKIIHYLKWSKQMLLKMLGSFFMISVNNIKICWKSVRGKRRGENKTSASSWKTIYLMHCFQNVIVNLPVLHQWLPLCIRQLRICWNMMDSHNILGYVGFDQFCLACEIEYDALCYWCNEWKSSDHYIIDRLSEDPHPGASRGFKVQPFIGGM